MTVLRPTPVSTSGMSYKNGSFVAEISDFGPSFRFGQVYDDACDEGLTLVSHRTGSEKVFAVSERKFDREGDLTSWELVSIGKNGRPDGLYSMTIFND